MSEKEDNFESGIFWELYKDLERQFENFLEYVPYLEGNENVYSFKLLNLILSIGGHVDSAFKEMARYPDFSNNTDCKKILDLLKESEENIKKGKAPKTIPIWLSLKAYEKEYQLSGRRVIFKRLPEREDVTPFKPHNPKTNAPIWWGIYNGLKHDVGVNIKEANLLNTLHALAGAFLINVIHEPAILRFHDFGMLTYLYKQKKGKYSLSIKKSSEFPTHIVENMLERKQSLPFMIETPLFIYEYEQ